MSKIIITPESKDQNYWTEVWQCRQIIFILSWRDISVRYKQTAIGVFWALLKPSITIGIFWVVSMILNIKHNDIPQIVLIGSAVIAWQYLSSSFLDISNSLINNDQIITKIYFPLIIIPLSSAIISLFDFAISIIILIVIYIFTGFELQLELIFLPVFVFLGFCATIGLGLFFATSSVKYRDFRVLVPFVVQIALYVSPVVFTSQMVYQSQQIKEWMKILYSLNPFVCVIDGFRWCLAGIEIEIFYFSLSLASIIILFLFGIYYFRKGEKNFAEFI